MSDTTTQTIKKIQTTVVDNMNDQWDQLIEFLPNLAGALIILLIGFIVAFIFKRVSTTLFRRLGLDQFSKTAGVSDVMVDAGLSRRPSVLAGKIVFWFVLFIFMVPAANSLGLDELVRIFKGFISYLPKIITALIIIILGIMFAQYLRRLISEKPATLGSNSARTLGNLVYGVMVTVIVLVALEQLEIETSLLYNIITLVVGGIMLGLALALGLGSREVAHNLLAGVYAREQFSPDTRLEVGDIEGKVIEVNTLNTLILTTDNAMVSIPNSKLYGSVITLPQSNK